MALFLAQRLSALGGERGGSKMGVKQSEKIILISVSAEVLYYFHQQL
jgi:hypothetical protein